MRYILLLTLLLAAPPLRAQQTPRTPAQIRAEIVDAGLLPGHTHHFRIQQEDDDLTDPWLAQDKVKHLVVSFLWTVGTQYALEDKFALSDRQALPLSMGSGVAVGISKEFYDWQYRTGLFSRRDLVADAIGIGAAAAFIWL